MLSAAGRGPTLRGPMRREEDVALAEYRRRLVDGGCYFFTLVTHDRRPLLTSPLARRCLRSAWTETRRRKPFRLDAVCLLPDHLHCVWTLPQDDADYPARWSMIKSLFTKRYLGEGGDQGPQNASRQRSGEATVWQRRYWEHVIRDDADFERHVNYTHYNPVKHGHVLRPADWKWSTFHKYLRQGIYDEDWGETEPRDVGGVSSAGEPLG